MNKNSSSLFLELLRAAIWNKSAEAALFQDLDASVWANIIALSESQKVNALLYDGILTLPTPLRPEKKVFYKLFLQTEAIEKSNRMLNSELKFLATEYSGIGCSFVLLKGQGNAALYPNPLRRSPGDIDLYFYKKEDYHKANQWAKNKGLDMDAENIHHQSFRLNGVTIENHKDICYFGIKKYDNLLKKRVGEIILNNHFLSLNIDGQEVKVLPTEFNAFYLFYHLFHHFIHLGVGLRQFCDWAIFMQTHSPKMDKKALLALAQEFDLLNAITIFASVSVKYLGVDPAVFPFDTDVNNEYVDIVMDDIFRGGNFGHSVFDRGSFQRKWQGKWQRFRYSTKRTRTISGIAPHHINPLPMIKILTNLKLLSKK